MAVIQRMRRQGSMIQALGVLTLLGFSIGGAQAENVRIFTLANADAEAMAALITRLTDGEVRLATDQRTNSVVVVASDEETELLKAILMKLDQPVNRKQKEVDAGEREKEAENEAEVDVEEEEEEQELRRTEERREIQERLEAELRERHEILRQHEHELQVAMLERETVEASLDHQANILQIDVKVLSTKLDTARQVHELMTAAAAAAAADGRTPQAKLAEVKSELALQELALRRKQMELEFLMSRMGPLQMRQIELEIESRKLKLQQDQRSIEINRRELEEMRRHQERLRT